MKGEKNYLRRNFKEESSKFCLPQFLYIIQWNLVLKFIQFTDKNQLENTKVRVRSISTSVLDYVLLKNWIKSTKTTPWIRLLFRHIMEQHGEKKRNFVDIFTWLRSTLSLEKLLQLFISSSATKNFRMLSKLSFHFDRITLSAFKLVLLVSIFKSKASTLV